MSPFPLGLVEFGRRFATDQACLDYLRDVRWPQGFRCRSCPCTQGYWLPSRGVVECAGCGQQVTLTGGTVMHKTKTDLGKWFVGAYLMATHTPGVSAVQFQRHARLRRYETAFQMLHKMRSALESHDRLAGTVEVDETYVVTKTKKVRRPGIQPRGRETVTKALVVAAVERVGKHAGRVRLKMIPHADRAHLHGFIRAIVANGATVRTDGWEAYQGLTGYRHIATVEGSAERAAVILPHVHRVFSNLKAWLIGTHHGVSRKHLSAYLNEFEFRFNRRGRVAASFHALLGLGAWQRSPTYRELYRAGQAGGWVHPNGLGSPVLTG